MRVASPTSSALTTATVRAIQTLGVGQVGLADQIADRLAEAIDLGLLSPGERLPAESALSDQLGVSTLTLREALAILRGRGLVITRRGRSGGSFVAAREQSSNLRSGLGRITVHQLRELGDLRRAISGAAAELAAERAGVSEVAALQRRADRFAEAKTPTARRRADAEFAIEVAAAAQSSRFTREESRLRAELGDLVWTSCGDAEHGQAIKARARLVRAIADGRGGQARRLCEAQVARETGLLIACRIELYAHADGEGALSHA